MTALARLIEKLEAASEGSRELDEDIALAIKLWSAWLSKHRRWYFHGPDEARFEWPDYQPEYDSQTGERITMTEIPWHGWAEEAGLPEWSTLLDAALSLVPGGVYWELNSADGESFNATTLVTGWHPNFVNAKTAPLALCIAALKARAALAGPSSE